MKSRSKRSRSVFMYRVEKGYNMNILQKMKVDVGIAAAQCKPTP
jgi:hypothetical protein